MHYYHICLSQSTIKTRVLLFICRNVAVLIISRHIYRALGTVYDMYWQVTRRETDFSVQLNHLSSFHSYFFVCVGCFWLFVKMLNGENNGEVRIADDADFKKLKHLSDDTIGWKQEYRKNNTSVWTRNNENSNFKMVKVCDRCGGRPLIQTVLSYVGRLDVLAQPTIWNGDLCYSRHYKCFI